MSKTLYLFGLLLVGHGSCGREKFVDPSKVTGIQERPWNAWGECEVRDTGGNVYPVAETCAEVGRVLDAAGK